MPQRNRTVDWYARVPESESDAQWMTRYSDFASWVGHHRRLPLRDGGRAEYERRLCYWMYAQRRLHRAGKLAAPRIARLARIPGFLQSTSIDMEAGIGALEKFHASRDRLPRMNATTQHEVVLARFLINDLRPAVQELRLPPELLSRARFLPGITPSAKRTHPDIMLKDVQDFCSKHGHLPARRQTVPREEFLLAIWLQRQQADVSDAGNESVRRRRRIVADLVSTYPQRPRTFGRPARPWQDVVAEVRQFCETHGRMPGRSRSSTAQETRLAHWLAKQTRNRDLTDESRALQQAIAELRADYKPAGRKTPAA